MSGWMLIRSIVGTGRDCLVTVDSADIPLIHTGSQLVVGQLTQGWEAQAADLHPLGDEAAEMMRAFGRCDPSTALGTGLVKVPRDEHADPPTWARGHARPPRPLDRSG